MWSIVFQPYLISRLHMWPFAVSAAAICLLLLSGTSSVAYPGCLRNETTK